MVECACAPAVVNPLSVSIQLEFWKNNVFVSQFQCFADVARRLSRIVYSDVSAIGLAAFIAIGNMPVFAQKLRFYVDEYQIEYHVERTPLCLFCFEKFAHLLSGCSVKWFTDNQTVPLIVDSGSMKLCSLQLAGDIFDTAKESNIKIEAELIPRSADYLCKIVD